MRNFLDERVWCKIIILLLISVFLLFPSSLLFAQDQKQKDDKAEKPKEEFRVKPNLVIFTPLGWQTPIIASLVKGYRKSTDLYADKPAYISFAIRNDRMDPTQKFFLDLYLDEKRVGRWEVEGLGWRQWIAIDDYEIIADAGFHIVKILIDPENWIDETSKEDNTFSMIFQWK